MPSQHCTPIFMNWASQRRNLTLTPCEIGKLFLEGWWQLQSLFLTSYNSPTLVSTFVKVSRMPELKLHDTSSEITINLTYCLKCLPGYKSFSPPLSRTRKKKKKKKKKTFCSYLRMKTNLQHHILSTCKSCCLLQCIFLFIQSKVLKEDCFDLKLYSMTVQDDVKCAVIQGFWLTVISCLIKSSTERKWEIHILYDVMQ